MTTAAQQARQDAGDEELGGEFMDFSEVTIPQVAVNDGLPELRRGEGPQKGLESEEELPF